jgi:type VI secretion system protein ImpH
MKKNMVQPANDRSPISQLKRHPQRFDFFQAIRLLETLVSESPDTRKRLPIGFDFRPDEEAVRLRAVVSHAFPSSAISELEFDVVDDDDKDHLLPPEMTVSFMGLTGPSGVLPQHYTRLLIDRVRAKDIALRDFLDLFHHRIISHFYRAWEKNHFAIAYESANRNGRTDPLTLGMYSLIGFGTAGLGGRLDVKDETFLFYGGQFSRAPKTAISLERMISDYFEVNTQVLQFQGQWLALSVGDQTCFATIGQPLGRNTQLGVTAVAGERVWGIESKFRVRLGPLNYEQFLQLTPGGKQLRLLGQFVRMYVGVELDFDIQPVLRKDEVPMCQLGASAAGGGARLGWNTWIRSLPMSNDADDAAFISEGLPA